MFPFRRLPAGPVPINRRALFLPTLVSLGLAGAFLYFLATRFDVNLNATWAQISAGNPWYLVLALVVHYTTFFFRGARWRLLLRNTRDQDSATPGVFYCSQLVLLGWFANSVAWFRLGDAYRAYLYREEQAASFSRTIGTILAERVVDAILVALLLSVSILFMFGGAAGTAWYVVGIALALAVLLVLALGVLKLARERALRLLPGWLGERYLRVHEGALGGFRQIVPVTVLGLLAWFSEITRLYLVAQALGFDLGLPLIIFITLANSLLTLVPTPGGFGAVESGVAGLLVRLSTLSASGAAALVVVDRAITFISIIIVGAVLLLARQILPQVFKGKYRSLLGLRRPLEGGRLEEP
ncbi:MAG: flippase-like domain-containing protein [Chloroflexi bacterium]|nr:flippase-like domain-containing protein [Chloroflexota bacterium]